jgi:asparagine synthetase B (glutamine-hydrolysing)
MFENIELKMFYNHKFDFENQHKTNYEDWLSAFKHAVKIRAKDGCFILMSSGYDSGAISKELSKSTKFKAFSILNNESAEVITARKLYIPVHETLTMNKELWQKYYDFLKGKIPEKNLKDPASMGISYIFETATKQGYKRLLAGQGADEIYSDYSLWPGLSTFKGEYPEKLYEWPNFRGGCNIEYLTQYEALAKLYTVETHYPYLDVNLVQEFLWLKAELKNRHYKAPLYEYLTRNKVPFQESIKTGFNPISK